MAFETFYGNEALKNSIYSHIKTRTLPHAIILEGEKGLGKHTLALLIASALLCQIEEPPCLSCTVCANVSRHNHPDVLYYESEKHTKDSFKIDTIRSIRELAFIRPNQSESKVFILGEADLMNAAAQNALLKVLEEPPQYVYFILLCERKSAFLETILSRCTVYTLERVSDATAFEAVRQLLPGPTEAEIKKCISLVGGNIGMVLSGLKGNEAIKANEKAIEIAEAVGAEYEFELLKALADFEPTASKALLFATCEPLKAVFRDALAIRCGAEAQIKMNQKTAECLAGKLTKKQIFKLIETCDELKRRLNANMNQKLLITWLCLALRAAVEYESGE